MREHSSRRWDDGMADFVDRLIAWTGSIGLVGLIVLNAWECGKVVERKRIMASWECPKGTAYSVTYIDGSRKCWPYFNVKKG